MMLVILVHSTYIKSFVDPNFITVEKTRIRRPSCTLAFILMTGCGGPAPYDVDFDIPRSEDFAQSLSAYGLYEEPLASLQPTDGAIVYELSSQLFTDYARKQRFMVVPDGRAITRVNEETFEFPEGSVLAKTFYYPNDMRDPNGAKRVIETRLLIKTSGVWNVATYLWNAEQTDATLLLDGTTTDTSWMDEAGQPRATNYAVPNEGECVTCHQSNGASAFIGPTVRNLNRIVTRNGTEVNQLAYLTAEGVVDDADWSSAPTTPDYRDDLPLERKARAYLDINCAHCHNPSGWDEVPSRRFDFRYTTPIDDTGLQGGAREVTEQLESGEMPYLGTTLLHDEGVRLVLDYVAQL